MKKFIIAVIMILVMVGGGQAGQIFDCEVPYSITSAVDDNDSRISSLEYEVVCQILDLEYIIKRLESRVSDLEYK